MYAKVFSQIFDSSIADDFRLRHFFMDLLVLADVNGVVDMTPTAIAARTRIPLDDVMAMLAKLEQPDHESRTPDHDGRRIARLDEHRTWGWCIINYSRFREIASEEQRREKTRERVARFKQKHQQNATGNAAVMPANAGNAMQKQRHRQKEKQKEGDNPPVESSLTKSAANEKTTAGKLTSAERISLEQELKRNTERLNKFGSLYPQFDGEKIRQRDKLKARNALIEEAIRIPL